MIKDGGVIHYHNTITEKLEPHFKRYRKSHSKRKKIESIYYKKLKNILPGYGMWFLILNNLIDFSLIRSSGGLG